MEKEKNVEGNGRKNGGSSGGGAKTSIKEEPKEVSIEEADKGRKGDERGEDMYIEREQV